MSTAAVDILIHQMEGKTEKEQVIINTALAEGSTVAKAKISGEF